MIKRGVGSIKRTHGTNYIGRQADARLQEVVKPYQSKGLNALQVDSFQVKYYARINSTTVCTCQQTEVLAQHSLPSTNLPPNLIKSSSNVDQEIVIDHSRPLFGTVNETQTADDFTDSDDFALDEDEPEHVIDNLFATNSSCGICYRSGYKPSFHLYGHERLVLATQDIENSYGYTIDSTKAPHCIEQIDPLGFVEFNIEIPKYFKGASYSIRNNLDILNDLIYFNSLPLTFTQLKMHAGSFLSVQVKASQFTHVVIEFDLNTTPLNVNIAQMVKAQDWTLFDTLGNLQVIMPMLISEVPTGGVIYVPSRNVTLKVTDVNYLRTARDSNLDWQVTTRVLQPQEGLKHIHKVYPFAL